MRTACVSMRNATPFTQLALALLLAIMCRTGFAAYSDTMILTREGRLPVLITVPHGGNRAPPAVPFHRRGTTVTDAGTIEVAEALAKHIERNLGAPPYLVAALFSRRHIDANRPADAAYESPTARPFYDDYHQAISRYVARIREQFPHGALLIDSHGQGADADVVHRGTRNGATVAALLRRHGQDALIGPQSLLGALATRGYRVFPPNTPPGTPPEHRGYSGGHTVHFYGSASAAGIDAIQLELGRALRNDERFTAALGEAVAVFYRAYLSGDASAASNGPVRRD